MHIRFTCYNRKLLLKVKIKKILLDRPEAAAYRESKLISVVAEHEKNIKCLQLLNCDLKQMLAYENMQDEVDRAQAERVKYVQEAIESESKFRQMVNILEQKDREI